MARLKSETGGQARGDKERAEGQAGVAKASPEALPAGQDKIMIADVS